MPSIINSDDGVVSGTSGLKSTGGNDGLLNIQSNGSTIVAVTGSGISVTGTVSQTGVSTFAAGTASAPSITFTGDTNTGIYSPGADTIAFTEGGTEAMRIDSSGRVGIGTTSADQTLVVKTVNGGGIGIENAAAKQWRWAVNSDSTFSVIESGVATRMTVDTSGNVGVGTTGPNGKLEVVSTSAGANTNTLFLTNASSNASTATSLVFGVSTGPTTRNATIRGINTGGNAIDLAFLTSNGDVPAERMRILSTGNILCLAGGSTTATGTGIAFPATQSASSDANTLDDYEEGTWNVVVSYSSSTSGVTYNSRAGYYTKIGNRVFINGSVSLSSKGTGSGTVQISLPFTSAERSGLAVGNTQEITANNSPREFMVEGGTTYFVIRYPSGTGSTTEFSYADIGNLYLVFAGNYRIS